MTLDTGSEQLWFLSASVKLSFGFLIWKFYMVNSGTGSEQFLFSSASVNLAFDLLIWKFDMVTSIVVKSSGSGVSQ